LTSTRGDASTRGSDADLGGLAQSGDAAWGRRLVNDEILNLATRFEDGITLFEFVCECGDPQCVGLVKMTLAEYRATKPGSVVGHD
jgi:hypothetical protein